MKKWWGKIISIQLPNKIFRRFVLVWAIGLITRVVLHILNTGQEISDAKFITVLGVLATCIGFYQWSREREDKRNGRTRTTAVSPNAADLGVPIDTSKGGE